MRDEQQETWCEELQIMLEGLDDAPVECDGMTHLITHVLSSAGIPHTPKVGYVRNICSEQTVSPHCWIELPDGWCIDFRLRIWLGDEPDIPHGVFHRLDYPGIEYSLKTSPLVTREISREVLELMSDGCLSKISPQIELAEAYPFNTTEAGVSYG